MHNFLQDILKESNTIIIPGLGALTVTSTKTGDIYFMPFLKHDDGHLAKYVSTHEGVELSEAKQILSNFVEAIKTAIAEGDVFEMENFGRFFKNKEGEVDFERWEDYQIKDNSILSKKVQERQQAQPKKVTPVIETKKEAQIKSVPVKSDEEIHQQTEVEAPISTNPIHLSVEETIIHPITEEEPATHQPVTEQKSIDELLGDTLTEETSDVTSSPMDVDTSNNVAIKPIITPIEDASQTTIIETNTESHIKTVEEIIEAPERDILIETDPIQEELQKEEKPVPVILDKKELRNKLKSEAAAKKAEEKRIKKAAQLEAKELAKSSPKEKKKSRSIILWLLSAVLVTGGVMWYIKTKREGEVHLTVIDKKESKVVTSKVIEKEELRNEIAKHREKETIVTTNKKEQKVAKKVQQKELKEAPKSVKPTPVNSTPKSTTLATKKVKKETAPDEKPVLSAKKAGKPSVSEKPSTKTNAVTTNKPTTTTASVTPATKSTPPPTAKPVASVSSTPVTKSTPALTTKPAATASATPAVKGTPAPTAKPAITASATPAAKSTVAPTAKPAVTANVTPTAKGTPAPTAKSAVTANVTPTAKGTPAPTAKPAATANSIPATKGTPAPTAKPAATANSTPATKGTPAPTTKPAATASSTPATKGTPAPTTKPAATASSTPATKGTPAATASATPAAKSTPATPVAKGTNSGYVSTNKNIQVIVGTFKDKTSADQFVTDLKGQGFTTAYSKEDNGQFSVSLGSFATLSESSKALQKYKTVKPAAK